MLASRNNDNVVVIYTYHHRQEDLNLNAPDHLQIVALQHLAADALAIEYPISSIQSGVIGLSLSPCLPVTLSPVYSRCSVISTSNGEGSSLTRRSSPLADR